MPTVELNKKSLLKSLGKNISDEKLSESITYIGGSVEESSGDYWKVEIEPNRPDLLSEQGLGRALSSYLEINKGLKKYSVEKSGLKLIVEKSAKNIRPFTACAIVRGLKFNDDSIKEVIQIQEKLHVTYGRNRKKCAIGVYPMEKIEFPIKLTAKDPSKIKFVPLESSGGREMTGLQVLNNHPTGRDYGFLLKGLDKFPFFIDSNNNVLSMPPIINSHNIGKVSEETTDVFIECSGFNQEVLDICLNIIVAALSDMGGKIYSIELENEHDGWTKDSPNFEANRMKIDLNYVNKILGLKLNEREMIICLEKMGFSYDSKSKEALIPSYRSDLLHMIDLVEDIAIAYGYMNFKEVIPTCATIAKRDPIEVLKSKVAEILSGLGLFETNTYCLVGDDQILERGDEVKLINSVSEGYDYMRKEILPSLLLALKNNKSYPYPQSFYEVGYTFAQGDTETKIIEGRNLSFVYADSTADYNYVRQVVDYLMRCLNLDYSIRTPKSDNLRYMSGRFGEIKINDISVGFLGQLSPELIVKNSIEVPVSVFEINFLKLCDIILQ